MKLNDVVDVFKHSLNELSDEDVVCVCLLYLLKKGFSGRLPRQPVIDDYFSFLSNLDEFKRYKVAIS